jgi:hypothetical protein
VLVGIELQEIPAHLWDLEITEFLLGAHRLVQGLLTDSSEGVDISDMTAFRLRVWCFSPDSLSDVLYLHAVEPRVSVEFGSWFPRTMVFKIAVKILRSGDVFGVDQPPPLLLDFGDDDRDQIIASGGHTCNITQLLILGSLRSLGSIRAFLRLWRVVVQSMPSLPRWSRWRGWCLCPPAL